MAVLEQQAVSVVLVGTFNPAIFSPAWLAKMGLISDTALETAKIEYNLPEIAKFAANDMSYEVVSTRFQLRTENEPFIVASDATAKIFGELLPHTPIKQLGINFETHFSTLSLEQRTNLGRALAPLEPWGGFGSRIKQDASRRGGMVTLVMQESEPNDRALGHRQARIEPSKKLNKETGVAIHINDHFEYQQDAKVSDATEVISILQNRFDDSLAESRKIAGELMEYAMSLEK